MMKILFLNPHLSDSPLLGALRNLGVAAIVCADARECEFVFRLHGSSVSLFVGHDEAGVTVNEIIKRHPRFSHVPVILTTSKWTDQQCIAHQATPQGANAYLRMPVEDKEFFHIVDQILGTSLSHGKGFRLADDLEPIEAIAGVPTSEGIALAPADERTRLAIVGADSAPVGEIALEGITLQTQVGDAGLSLAGFQVEDGATVNGITPSSSDGGDDPLLVFNLEAPKLDTGGYDETPRASNEGNTKEFRIEAVAGGFAEEIVAVPIEATSIGAIPAMDEVPRVTSASPKFADAPVARISDDLDAESLATMPYLGRSDAANPLDYREPMDDAVVPGGAANAPDVETLKKYLYLREQDVTALSAQLRQAREQIGNLEGQLRQERAVSSEFAHLAQEQDRRISGFEKEKAVALESAQREFDELKFEMKRRSEKIRVMELQVREATDATERLKERVRTDIRKIRTREKELENRLEIMKKDSEALLGTRERKIIELKQKLDLMEFNTDLVQELLEKERQTAIGLRAKLAKAAQMMRVAGGILGPDEAALLDADAAVGRDERSKNDRTTAA